MIPCQRFIQLLKIVNSMKPIEKIVLEKVPPGVDWDENGRDVYERKIVMEQQTMETTMKYFVYVVADMNDADYTSQLTEISLDDLTLLKPYFEKIMEPIHEMDRVIYATSEEDRTAANLAKFRISNYRHNWPTSEYTEQTIYERWPDIPKDILDRIDEDFVPFGEYGIHTIKEIQILTVENVENL